MSLTRYQPRNAVTSGLAGLVVERALNAGRAMLERQNAAMTQPQPVIYATPSTRNPNMVRYSNKTWTRPGYKKTVRTVSKKTTRAKPKYQQKKQYKKKTKTFQKRVQSVINSTKAVGKYKKCVVDAWNSASDGVNDASSRVYSASKPQDILDAVAVLFNGKTAAEDANTTVGNFTGDAFDIPGFSFNTKHFVTNYSQHPIQLDVWTGVAKDALATNMRDAWNNGLARLTNKLDFDFQVKPSDGDDTLKKYWKMEYRTVTIKPGERKFVCSQAIGLRTIKTEDLYTGNFRDAYMPWVSKEVMFKVRKHPTIIGYNATSAKVGTGFQLPNFAYALQHEEYSEYRMACPDNAERSQNQDKVIYFDNLQTTAGSSFIPTPYRPTVGNAPNNAQ